MVVRKHKKIRKQRGSRTHGWGLVHRGSGQRGGVGNAGRGKKAHCKKPQVWKERYLGKHGFVKQGFKEPIRAVSLKHIEQNLDTWNQKQLVLKQQDTFQIDLNKIGYTKLLSTGHATKKMNITVKTAVPAAIKKVEAAGGKVVTAAQ